MTGHLSDSSENIKALQARITALEEGERRRLCARHKRKRQRRGLGKILGLSVLLCGFVAVVAGADPTEPLTCPAGDLYCFEANTAAKADQVNHNFAQLQKWLELKVGTVGDSAVSTDSLSVSDTLSASGGTVTINGRLGLRIERNECLGATQCACQDPGMVAIAGGVTCQLHVGDYFASARISRPVNATTWEGECVQKNVGLSEPPDKTHVVCAAIVEPSP